MRFSYLTNGTCSDQIDFDITGDVISNISFSGGCDGNLQAIPRLIDGWTVDEIAERLKGIDCDGRGTSCADQLVHAIYEATGRTYR